MKTISLVIIFSYLLLHSQAQLPRDTAYYLSSQSISKAAKDYYKGKYKASDDARTLSILDSLKTRNNSTRPFYVYLVSKMMKKSDGALSEVLGIACKDCIEWHPDDALEILYSNASIVTREFIDNWVKSLAEEFMIDCEGKEKQCIKASFDKATVKCNERNRKNLQDLYNRIGAFVKARS